MAYPKDTIKYGIAGNMPNGTRFSFGFQMMGGNGAPDTQVDAGLGALIQGMSLSTVQNGLLGCMSPSTTIDTLSAYHYPGGGPADAVSTSSVTYAGTAAGNPLPNQAALVVSLRTASNTRQGRGRIFVPATGLNLTSGQTDTSHIQLLAGAIHDIFGAFNLSESGLPQTPVVASATHSVTRPITRLIVDSRIDVIRHRAQGEQILHSYTLAL